MNTYPGIITSRRTRRNLRHFRLLPINPPTESAVQFRAARALNQLSSHASLLVGKWRQCRNSTNYQHHIWRSKKISNSVTLFAVRPISIYSREIANILPMWSDYNFNSENFENISSQSGFLLLPHIVFPCAVVVNKYFNCISNVS